MASAQPQFPRGAEWRQWDFHVHTPASFHWCGGKRFEQMTPAERTQCLDEMINALNQASPALFVLMDYWTFDGWFALKERVSTPGAPALNKKVFPGIELRLVSPTNYRLNAHVVFSDEVSDQDLKNFRSQLNVALIDQPLSEECLVRLVRERIDDDLLREKGFTAAEVAGDAALALKAGSMIAEVTTSTYQEAIKKVPGGKAIGFMPWDTNDGLSRADWKTHYAYVIGLMNSSPIFETRRQELWAAFSGIETESNKDWISSFQSALLNIPRLAVSGSDAHRFAGVPGDIDKRGYGDFPSGKATWIKADPTFLGLLQAIKEPARRSFIGDTPPKLMEMEANRTYFIDSIEVTKNDGSPLLTEWLSKCKLPLNGDLVAIIGNKGSGKSALADVIALLGNSRQVDEFSFLSPKRFRKKPSELARHFTGFIKWRGQSPQSRPLSENPPVESVELVRYIPQTHFEKLCNDHVTGKSKEFEEELRAVIFSHTSSSIRQKALDFDQLVEQQESTVRDHLGELRKDLRKINQDIEGMEAQLQPEVERSLLELLALKEKQIEEHFKNRPRLESKPTGGLTAEQQQASQELEAIAVKVNALVERALTTATQQAKLAAKAKALRSLSTPLRQVLSEISVASERGGLLSHELFWGIDPDGFWQG